jgi:hypothetical protein
MPLTDPSQFDILQSGLAAETECRSIKLKRREFIALLGGARPRGPRCW